MDAQTLTESGDTATVPVSYRLLGSDLSFQMPMERIDGGWYSRDLVRNAREELEGDNDEADELLDEPAEYEDEEIIEEDDLAATGTDGY